MKELLEKLNLSKVTKKLENEKMDLEEMELLEDEGINGNINIGQKDFGEKNSAKSYVVSDYMELAELIVKALGGKNNLKSIDACITRLRLEVEDPIKVDESEIERLGAARVLKVGEKGIQAIFGSKAKAIAIELKKI